MWKPLGRTSTLWPQQQPFEDLCHISIHDPTDTYLCVLRVSDLMGHDGVWLPQWQWQDWLGMTFGESSVCSRSGDLFHPCSLILLSYDHSGPSKCVRRRMRERCQELRLFSWTWYFPPRRPLFLSSEGFSLMCPWVRGQRSEVVFHPCSASVYAKLLEVPDQRDCHVAAKAKVIGTW